MLHDVVTVTMTCVTEIWHSYVTSHCSSFTKSKNRIIENKKDLDKKRNKKETSPPSLILTLPA